MKMSNHVIEWSEKVRRQAASGKSAATWCKEHSIAYQSFIYWRKRLSPSSPSLEPLNRSSFLELPQSEPKTWMEISVPGVKLAISKDFDREALLRCMQMLGGL